MIADAVGLLGADGSEAGRMPWAEAGGRPADAEITTATAARGDWQVRILRIDAGGPDGPVRGVRLTGHALPVAPGEPVRVTDVHQGVDVCVGAGADALHSELRMLVPWDGRVAVADAEGRCSDGDSPYGDSLGDDGGPGSPLPYATVDAPPIGFPIVVAVRRGVADPAVPQIEERAFSDGGRPLRILRTGQSIPEVELAPTPDGGHAVTVLWPDRTRETVVLPPRPAASR